MNKTLRGLTLSALLGGSALAMTAGTALADCGFAEGRVSIIGNEFPAIRAVADRAAECAAGGVEVNANLTSQHQTLNVAGMSTTPPEYTSAIIANSSIVALINDDVIRPLNDLVAAYGDGLQPHQLITINGDIMAVAFMANAQHLVYREDVLNDLGIAVPTSYEEVLAAAEQIRAAGVMQYPVGGAYASGWNLAQEFVNMYLGHGGQFFAPGSAEVTINNEAGVAALEMMAALTEYMNPDFLTHDSNATSTEWMAGNVALMNMWGSRTQVLMEPEGSAPEVHTNTRVGGPLMVGDSGVPATTLWWDGWTVAKNASDADAEATFRALAHAIQPDLLNDETQQMAVWMIEGYEPTPVSSGVLDTISAQAQPYPMLPYMGLLHTALGDNLAPFLQGRASATEVLEAVEAAYTSAARERGFLN
ncbi:ABC transporter substrate-binding protein [Roseicyclus marinus]|uniref:ABC transporter substrate-binding protein n=1 Tax=Roseicyclus marinus TaxID=2161673 RepID=UPI0024100A27|nr:extracellular solute-binding protein [Roseicyclus marinus]MDG3042338.1 extracellular solute-binding protein [Roseicyclus marinus]